MRQKILDLFEYREFPYLLSFVEAVDRERLEEKLIAIQEAIYHLDLVLESKWEIEESEFEPHWKAITQTLRDVGVAKEDTHSYLTHIRTYLKHEMLLRDGVAPTRLDIEEYYYYKSCDVQLIRRVIYDQSAVLQRQMSLDSWRYFDYITEVNDDVTDIVEDHESINGNGVAFYINEYGIEDAKRTLEGFIKSARVQSSHYRLEKPNDQWLQFIERVTEKASYETLALIGQLKSVLLHQQIEIEENKTIKLVAQAKKLKQNSETDPLTIN